MNNILLNDEKTYMNTIEFAKYELNKYLSQMGACADISFSVDATLFDGAKFEHYDPALDDAFSVFVKGGHGSITATNERSVLMGVYHYLKAQGCRFMMPGTEGEYIPIVNELKDIDETWYAYTRHRGTTDTMLHSGGIDCILKFIDWLPQMAMNSFFIELTDCYYDMWYQYRYEDNPYKNPDSLSKEQFEKWHGWMVSEIKKRSILYHGAGHGWTNMLMDGITETKRKIVIDITNDTTPCLNTEILPEINGKRELSQATPLNTNLCFSKDEVRKLYAKKVYEYSVEHPEMDYIHVWLGDAFSNFCECENCRKLTPTDWYIKVINEVDEEFTRHGSSQKIVFLGYFELLYPPVTERIKNEERFTFLFCPYGRDFTKRYREWEVLDVEPIPLNGFKDSDMHMGLYLGQLKKWKECFGGDCAVFDYNLGDFSAFADITHSMPAPIMADDCLYMKQIGLNGRIECGNNLYMFPTPIAWHAMCESLFYGREYSEKDFYVDFFGDDERMSEYIKMIQAALPFDYMYNRRQKLSSEEITGIKNALKETKLFREELFEYSPRCDFHRRNSNAFRDYLDITEFILNTILKMADNISKEEATIILEEYRKLVFHKEALFPSYIQGHEWFHAFAAIIKKYIEEKQEA